MPGKSIFGYLTSNWSHKSRCYGLIWGIFITRPVTFPGSVLRVRSSTVRVSRNVINTSKEQNPFKRLVVPQPVKEFRAFMGPEGVIHCSQKLATGPYLVTVESRLHLTLLYQLIFLSLYSNGSIRTFPFLCNFIHIRVLKCTLRRFFVSFYHLFNTTYLGRGTR